MDCGKGYLTLIQSGKDPIFKVITLKTKQVPVCKCQQELDVCQTCGQGYLEQTKRGFVPFFKEIVTDEPEVDEASPGEISKQNHQFKFQISNQLSWWCTN